MSNTRERPNILLITSDQHHYQYLGATMPRLRTPALDRLCDEGTRFERAYCCNPTCTPERASIITGMYPSQHGAWSLGTKLFEDVPTLGDMLGQAGYFTSLVGKAHFQPLASRRGMESIECQPTLRDLDFWRGFKGRTVHDFKSTATIPEWVEFPVKEAAGVNSTVPCEVAASMDPVALRAQFGRELRIGGGFDKRIVAAGPAAVKAELAHRQRRLPRLLLRDDPTGRSRRIRRREPRDLEVPDLPIGPVDHGFDAAADGQLGGLISIFYSPYQKSHLGEIARKSPKYLSFWCSQNHWDPIYRKSMPNFFVSTPNPEP